MLILIFLIAVCSATSPLENTNVYFEALGNISYLPSNCTKCPNSCPNCQCYICNLKTINCSFTDFLQIDKPGSVELSTTAKPCQRERLYIYNPGFYRVTINKLGQYLQFIPFRYDQSNDKIKINFVLGYAI